MFVIAHRGANKYAPQNTIEAFKKALEQRADGVETDIRITKDGHLVLSHNNTITSTSDGRGKISKQYLGELFNYDFGSWFGSKFANTAIPTIEDFFRLMKKFNPQIIDIELKPDKRGKNIVSRVLDMAKAYDLNDKVLISSFDINILKAVKQADPSIKTGYLYPSIGEIARLWFKDPMQRAVNNGVDYLLPEKSYVDSEFVQKAHKHGLKVAVWTVNKIELINKYHIWGVDGVITDYPEIMKNKINAL